MTTRTSIYSPLLRGTHSLRLINLVAGRLSEEVELRMFETSLYTSTGTYRALSYAWGNRDVTRSVFIRCNGRQVPVSSNLRDILRRLRRPDHEIVLWVDALCINQADDDERTHQVSFMRLIYENAAECIIWLGEPPLNSDMGASFFDNGDPLYMDAMLGNALVSIKWRNDESDDRLLQLYKSRGVVSNADSIVVPNDVFGAFCLIYQLARGESVRNISYVHGETTNEDFMGSPAFSQIPLIIQAGFNSNSEASNPVRIMNRSSSNRVLNGLSTMMNAEWWSRIWVIQETVVAKRATLHYGMLSAPWAMFAQAATNFEHDRIRNCLDLSWSFPGLQQISYFSERVLQIESTRLEWQRPGSDQITILSLLRKFRAKEASDQRDKVFALLGMVNYWHDQEPFQPSYRFDIGHVFRATTLDTIRGTQSLSILSGDLTRRRVNAQLPSWVMDWSYPTQRYELDRLNSTSLFNTSAGNIDKIWLHGNDILEVGSVHVDSILAVGEALHHTQINETLATIRKWKFMASIHLYPNHRYSPSSSQLPTKLTRHDAFWLTLISDVLHDGLHSAVLPSIETIRPRCRRARSPAPDAAMDGGFEGYNSVLERSVEIWSQWARCIARDTSSRTAVLTAADLADGVADVHYALLAATTSRCFFITRDGYMGMGPIDTQVGDEVRILLGSRVPFVVRRGEATSASSHGNTFKRCMAEKLQLLVSNEIQKNERECAIDKRKNGDRCWKKHDCHRLVGDCFVTGIMDGELMTARPRRTEPLYII